MSSPVKSVYSSSACNRSPNVLDWNKNNIICYGSCNGIELYKYEKGSGGSHLQTLVGHKKIVTSVHWIKKSDNSFENELISTSADSSAVIWTSYGLEFSLSSSLTGHSNVVRNATGIYLSEGTNNDLLIATVSMDSSLKLWTRRHNTVTCTQTISFNNGFGLDVKFAVLNYGSDLIMLVGADDAKIHIFVQNNLGQFTAAAKLDGHADWIQSLDIAKDPNDTSAVMLASASQDYHIRIWKISTILSEVPEQDLEASRLLKTDEILFAGDTGQTYCVTLESILPHENWVYSARWFCNKNMSDTGEENVLLLLLTASMDKTMIIWEASTSTSLWMEKVCVGEVGGNTLGFYGGVFSPCGEIIVGHGFQGAIHVWEFHKEEGSWQPGFPFGGHYSSVQDIDWDPDGEYLLSCSYDQTTRLHAPYVNNGKISWHEISRPQIHGYDMVCLSVLDRFRFVSGGDEKVLRVFEAPRNFAETLEKIAKVDTSVYLKNKLAEGATVPSLGLSNKAVFQQDLEKANPCDQGGSNRNFKDLYPDVYYTPTHLTAPPTEETLLQNTLWPEVQKLYGHPYEVFTVTSNHSKTLIASACKASKVEHAGIILWSTSTWRQVATLLFHNLTVTQMEFSPDDKYLLSVSRDRMWAVYCHFPHESPPYRKIASLDKKSGVHSRIIWSCSWSFDSLYFVTASRDRKVAVWEKNNSSEGISISLCLQPLEVEDSATAVTFAPCFTLNNKYLIAIGLENGCIVLTSWNSIEGWSIFRRLQQNIAHHLTIN
ncbi:Elongator complex protein 2, partial [Stegodyphus mimosarum]